MSSDYLFEDVLPSLEATALYKVSGSILRHEIPESNLLWIPLSLEVVCREFMRALQFRYEFVIAKDTLCFPSVFHHIDNVFWGHYGHVDFKQIYLDIKELVPRRFRLKVCVYLGMYEEMIETRNRMRVRSDGRHSDHLIEFYGKVLGKEKPVLSEDIFILLEKCLIHHRCYPIRFLYPTLEREEQVLFLNFFIDKFRRAKYCFEYFDIFIYLVKQMDERMRDTLFRIHRFSTLMIFAYYHNPSYFMEILEHYVSKKYLEATEIPYFLEFYLSFFSFFSSINCSHIDLANTLTPLEKKLAIFLMEKLVYEEDDLEIIFKNLTKLFVAVLHHFKCSEGIVRLMVNTSAVCDIVNDYGSEDITMGDRLISALEDPTSRNLHCFLCHFCHMYHENFEDEGVIHPRVLRMLTAGM